MGLKIGGLFDRLLMRHALRRWRAVAAEAGGADLATLRAMRGPARQTRREIDRLLHVADGRLSLPAIGSDVIRKPLMSDWAWRPELWCGPVSPPGLAAVAVNPGVIDTDMLRSCWGESAGSYPSPEAWATPD